MKNAPPSLAALLLLMLAAFCAASSVFGFGGSFEMNEGSIVLRDPVREAEATRVALAAQGEAAQRAIELQVAQAEMEKAWVDVDARRGALPAAVLHNTLVHTGLGVAALVLAIGGAFALVAWLNKRAAWIYPNEAGQYPILVRQSLLGDTWLVHDPNRALGPTTIYTLPVLPGRAGQPQAHFPASGSEEAMLQIASQAQAVSLVAAASQAGEVGLRRRGAGESSPQSMFAQAIRAVTGGYGRDDEPASRMPSVRVISDPGMIEEATVRFESEGQ